MSLARRIAQIERAMPAAIASESVETRRERARALLERAFGTDFPIEGPRAPLADLGPCETPEQRRAAARRLIERVFGGEGRLDG